MFPMLHLALMAFSAACAAVTPAPSPAGPIDVHSHVISDNYRQFVKAHGAELSEGFPLPAWDEKKHIAWMDKAGIQTSILTLPAPHPYFGNTAESAAFCRKSNEANALLKARYAGRLLYCAVLPLPDVQAAAAEAIHALDHLGADCVQLATNTAGLYLGDPALEPLMEVLDQRHAVIILHPHKPSAANETLLSSVPLASYEYLAETARRIEFDRPRCFGAP